jgi:hypothetical protein
MTRAGYRAGNGRKAYELSKLDRQDFLEALRTNGGNIAQARAVVDVSVSGYSKWRGRYPEFRAEVDFIRNGTVRQPGKGYDGDFPTFRRDYLGTDTPLFQIEMVDAYSRVAPGNILLVLMPPEHGKTTTYEDYATRMLALHGETWRATVASEKQKMAIKILARIKKRLISNVELIRKFGPFRSELGAERSEQAWAADFFNVWSKRDQDERDYSMVALGFGSAVAGTRTDHLHIDDVQSLKSLPQTEKILDEFRQDWLSRPGEDGITTIAGTRVGETDFYERLEEEIGPDILKVIRLPAIVPDTTPGAPEGALRPLWHERYTMDQLERQRRKVGEEAWARNYMQSPRPTGVRTFVDSVIEPSLNKLRKLHTPPERGRPSVLALDPALGSFAPVMAAQFTPEQMTVTHLWEGVGFGRNEQLFDLVTDGLHYCRHHGADVSDLIVESNAMQKGLARDDRLNKLTGEYGFTVHEHLTGTQKYDSAIGIPAMARDLRLNRIDLPYAGDETTRYWIDELIRQLKAWRPNVKGNVLRMDRVMVMWFLWLRWKDTRGVEKADTSAFDRAGLGSWSETRTGLSVPSAVLRQNSLVLGGQR